MERWEGFFFVLIAFAMVFIGVTICKSQVSELREDLDRRTSIVELRITNLETDVARILTAVRGL